MNDNDWMAGPDLESCIEAYVREWSGDLPREEAVDDPRELSEEEMDRLAFVDEDAAVRRSFREELARLVAEGEAFPRFFASSEY